MPKSLQQWLGDLELRGPAPIALGLDRVAQVDQTLRALRGVEAAAQPLVFMVAGTNGKGSTVCYIDSVLRAAGLRCGRFTSPHLIEYAERIVVDGVKASEQAIVSAFERIESARADTELTYFEFSTLAALEVFRDAKLDAWVLEVGLGGRLDAVNIIDADVAVITSIDLDHQQYLGNDREGIGLEKAGIMRPGRPAVLGDPAPPHSVIKRAAELNAPLYRIGHEFTVAGPAHSSTLRWRAPDDSVHELPQSPLPGDHQRRNLAAALTALWCMRDRWPFQTAVLRDGVLAASLSGRLQRLPAHCALYLDVAHNPDGARALAAWLGSQRRSDQRILAVFALLADKDLEGVLEPLLPLIDEWSLAELEGARAHSGVDLASAISARGEADASIHPSVITALRRALDLARSNDLVVVFGSFLVAEQVLRDRG